MYHLIGPVLFGHRGCSGRQFGQFEGLRVHDDLDDKVLLDLGVLEARLVCEELAGEEPALVGDVDVLLSLELLLQLPNGVGHAGAQPQVFPCRQPHLELELLLGSDGGLGAVAGLVVAALRDQVDGRGQAVHRQLVTVPQLVVTFCQSTVGQCDARSVHYGLGKLVVVALQSHRCSLQCVPDLLPPLEGRSCVPKLVPLGAQLALCHRVVALPLGTVLPQRFIAASASVPG